MLLVSQGFWCWTTPAGLRLDSLRRPVLPELWRTIVNCELAAQTRTICLHRRVSHDSVCSRKCKSEGWNDEAWFRYAVKFFHTPPSQARALTDGAANADTKPTLAITALDVERPRRLRLFHQESLCHKCGAKLPASALPLIESTHHNLLIRSSHCDSFLEIWMGMARRGV